MEATIKVEGISAKSVIGKKQKEVELDIDVEMKTDITETAQTDAITDTIDCEKVIASTVELARARSYHLLETFAYVLVHEILAEFSVTTVKVRIRKEEEVKDAKALVVECEASR